MRNVSYTQGVVLSSAVILRVDCQECSRGHPSIKSRQNPM